jgi:predicted HicB family RNase H-like nuclease
VYAQLCQIVDEWLEILKTDGIPLPAAPGKKEFSGKFILRAEPALHRRLALRALAAGESLNNYCVKVLSKG